MTPARASVRSHGRRDAITDNSLAADPQRSGRVELASRQFWAIARAPAARVGFSERAGSRSWLSSGRLHRVLPGVYAWGRAELSEAGQLAARLLYAGPGSALTGVDRALVAGAAGPAARGEPTSPLRVVTHPGPASASRHPAEGAADATSAGCPWPPSPQRSSPPPPSWAATPCASCSRAPSSSACSISAQLTRPHWRQAAPAPAAVRAAMDAHLPQLAACANGRERDFVLLCERHGLPIPEPNTRIGRYRPDMLWPDRRLIVEIDGKRAHSTPAQLAADARRQAHLEQLGYRVIRFAAERIVREPERVAAELQSAARVTAPSATSAGRVASSQVPDHLVAVGAVVGDVLHLPRLQVGRDLELGGIRVEFGEERAADASRLRDRIDGEEPEVEVRDGRRARRGSGGRSRGRGGRAPGRRAGASRARRRRLLRGSARRPARS